VESSLSPVNRLIPPIKAIETALSIGLAAAIDLVRINETHLESAGSKLYLHKRRKWGRGAIIAAGNVFLKLSDSRITMFPDVREWQIWEVETYQLLHGPTCDCYLIRPNAVMTERLSGIPIRTLISIGSCTASAVIAGGLAFRVGHGLYSDYWHAGWSHGDPHPGNVLYDSIQDRAFLIDFETRHDQHLTAHERYADDLLTFILELIGTADQWYEWCKTFLEAYGDQAVIKCLIDRLVLPRGLARVLWRTRTNHLADTILQARLLELSTQLRTCLKADMPC